MRHELQHKAERSLQRDGDVMGYLTLPAGAGNMNKVVISVFFRIPAAAAAAVQARDTSTDIDVTVMDHVVPLIMFGEQQTSTIHELTSETVYCEFPPTYTIANNNAPSNNMVYSGGSHTVPAQQSCIGVQCLPAQDPTLYVHIQPNTVLSVSNLGWNKGPGFTCPLTVIDNGGTPIPDFSVSTTPGTLADGAVGNSNNSLHGPEGGAPVVTLDHWHHLLLSWELRSESAHGGNLDDVSTQDPAANISSYSLMYCALDDVNKNRNNLPATWIGQSTDFSDPNAIVCGGIMNVAGSLMVPNPRAGAGPDPSPYSPPTGDLASGSMIYGTIPSSPLWVPGDVSIETGSRGTIVGGQDAILAEMQIFTGVALDTSVVGSRRAFIKADGTPEKSSAAQALLGKKPEVLFHGSDDFKNGRNTGTRGAFAPTGTIDSYEITIVV